MQSALTVEIAGNELLLLPEKAIWWNAEQCLLLADLHLGKTAHFRKNGIPIPLKTAESNFSRLGKLLSQFEAAELCILGDFTHSSDNHESVLFELFRQHFPDLKINLLSGNHDILSPSRYPDLGIDCSAYQIRNGILLAHEPIKAAGEFHYALYGHIHPAAELRGTGRQKLRLPCYWMGNSYGLLPAFGAFTGMGNLPSGQDARVFVCTDSAVMEIG